MLRIPKTSSVPEKDAFYSSLVERCVNAIVGDLGEDNIRGLLMIGAPARSEATVVELPRGMYSLSDVDLICVLRPGADPVALRSRLAIAVADLNGEIEDLCSGVDVSLKSEQQLEAPIAAIANYEMVRSPVAVWGDERITSTLGDVDIADVPGDESLKLIHNRIVEELLAGRRPPAYDDEWLRPLNTVYATAKLTLDSITAHLFLRNNVPTSFADRVRYFVEDVLARPESSRLREELVDHVDELPAWALFKTTGSLEGLESRFGSVSTPDELQRVADATWARAIRYAEVFWRAILGDAARTNLEGRDLEGLGKIYRRLESLPRSGARALRMLKPGRAPEGLFSPLRTLFRARLASPRLLAYFVAVATYLSYSDTAEWEQVRRIALKYCPFDMPRGFSALDMDGMRDTLIERIAEYHHGVLLGRKGKGV